MAGRPLIQPTLISIVTPVLNEQDNIPLLYGRIANIFKDSSYRFELILVENGSTDRSVDAALELRRKDDRVKLLSLSRSFGHQIALTAGLDYAQGEAVILMDSDLQHPPEVIPALIDKWREGFENVYTIREPDPSTPFLKRNFSRLFYKIFRAMTKLNIPQDSADFRLLDRKIVVELRKFPEKSRFLRGIIYWAGYKTTGIKYQEDKRLHGETKYNLARSVLLSIDAITSFSTVPLYLGVVIGFSIAALGFLYLFYAFYIFFFTHIRFPGWASIICLLAILGGFILIIIGIIGIYIGKIFEEVKNRPLYLVDRKEGFNEG